MPDSPLIAGQVINIGATVLNRSAVAAGPVSVSLVATDEASATSLSPVTTSILSVNGQQSATAMLAWDTDGLLPGLYGISIAVDAPGDTDATNNSLADSVDLVNSMALVEVSPKTATVIVGRPLQFTAKVKNVGPDDLEDVAAGLFETDTSALVAEATLDTIASGATLSAALIWDTAGQAVDNRSLIVAISADDQGSDNDDWQWVTVHLKNPVALSAAVSPDAPTVAGSPVSVEARVSNLGIAGVGPVTVNLYVDGNSDAAATETIDTLDSGETSTATLTWDTADAAAGEHSLRVAASLRDYAADADDEAEITVSLAEPVVDAAFVGSMTAPAAIIIGKDATFTATLANHGNIPTAATVGLHVAAAATSVATATVDSIDPGATTDVVVEWDDPGPDTLVGERRLRLVAEAPGDTDSSNDAVASSVKFYRSAFASPDAPDQCVDDVGVAVQDILDVDHNRRDMPHYWLDETLHVAYRVYNYSCATDVEIDVDLAATQTGVSIEDSDAPCLAGCLLPAGAQVEGIAVWPLSSVPEAIGETVTASAAVSSPADFDDANPDNDSATSDQSVNIAHPEDIAFDSGRSEGRKSRTKDDLASPKFGFVDLRLMSAAIEPTTVPHSGGAMTVSIEASNAGREMEPAAVEVSRTAPQGTEAEMLFAATVMIPPGADTKRATFDVPTDGLVIGKQTVQVELAAVNNVAQSGNRREFAVARLAPPVVPVINDVEIIGIASVPPGEAMQGQWVEILVTVRNNGRRTIYAPVLLTFPSEAKQPERKSPRLKPGESETASFTWKTGNYDPGVHTLTADLLAENNATAGSTSAELQILLTEPIIAASVVEISTDPAAPVAGEPVAITVTVRNDGLIAANIPVTLRFPSADKQPETRRPRVRPGETGEATFTWRTGNYSPGSHLFTVEAGAGSRDFIVELLPPSVDFTVTDLSTPDRMHPVVRGDWVQVSAQVQNMGPHAGRSEIVLQDATHQKAMYRRSITLEPGGADTVEFTWKTLRYNPGDYLLQAAAEAENDLNPQNNVSNVGPVTVLTNRDITLGFGSDSPPTGSAGVLARPRVRVAREDALTDIELATADPPAHVRSAMAQPNVHVDREPALTDLELATAGPPAHVRSAMSRPDLHFKSGAAGLFSIVGITVAPEFPVVGQPVTITVSVRNDGTTTAIVPVTLHFPAVDKEPETRRPRIRPGETVAVDFTWRTTRYDPGTHSFRIESPAAVVSAPEIAVELLPTVLNASIVGIGSDPAGIAIRGQPVEVWVEIRNDGPVATSVPVQLTFPSADKSPERRSPRIQPGEIRRVSFTWKTGNYGAGSHTLVATLLASNNSSTGATSAQLQIRLTDAETSASVVGASWLPQSPAVGDAVSITVEVRNDSPAAGSIPITLHFPSPDKQPETRRPRIAPGETGSATFTWRTSRYRPGLHEFRVEIGGNPPTVHRFTIELLQPVADFTVVEIYPPPSRFPIAKGDWVEVAAFVRNLGPHQGRATIDLYNETAGRTMYSRSVTLGPGESRVVEFTWKTLRYGEGEHTVSAIADGTYDQNRDNDRSPPAVVNILTGRDITVGFGNASIPPTIVGAPDEPYIRSAARYPVEIFVIDGGAATAAGAAVAPPADQIGVSPQRRTSTSQTGPIHRLQGTAQYSPGHCARFQSLTGESQPRAVLCPKAPTLIR